MTYSKHDFLKEIDDKINHCSKVEITLHGKKMMLDLCYFYHNVRLCFKLKFMFVHLFLVQRLFLIGSALYLNPDLLGTDIVERFQ